MPKEIEEWGMVVELAEMADELEPKQRKFIKSLYDHLDPFLDFLEQQSEDQQKYLYSLYERYVNGDTESANEYYED